MGDQGATHGQTGGSRRTIVVNIVDGDRGQSELIENPLATGAVAVNIACNTLVNIVVVDVGVQHGLDTGFEAQLMVVDLATGLDEFGHTNAQDVGGSCFFSAHDIGISCLLNRMGDELLSVQSIRWYQV